MDYVSLGQRIRAERKSRRLTQEALAEAVGISLSFLGHIERGSRKASVETLVGISNALGVSMDSLLQDSLMFLDTPRINPATDETTLLKEINRLIESNLKHWNQ